jgi:N-acetyl sugar amidotransferase
MFDNLKYCTKCILPETVEGQSFDENGLCKTCQSQAQKQNIDWSARREALSKIFADAKASAGNNYDCIVPISGGKDSTWQMHVLVKEFGMKPLAVTHSHNWFSKTGWYNLMNGLEKFGLDHIMFTPSRQLVNRCARRSVETIGDACWHCHAGVAAFVLKMAVAYKIPLIIWGESTAEHGRATYDKPDKFDRDYFLRVSAKLNNEQFACEYLSLRDLFPFEVPSVEECESIGLNGIHLGDYIFWDTEKQVEFIKKEYGWKGTQVEGAYKDYKSVECSMAGIHDFLCYLKRGYGRASIQASGDIRDGLISKEEGFRLAERYERILPKSIHYFLGITGMTFKELATKLAPLVHEKCYKNTSRFIEEWRDIPEAGKPFMQRLIDGEV